MNLESKANLMDLSFLQVMTIGLINLSSSQFSSFLICPSAFSLFNSDFTASGLQLNLTKSCVIFKISLSIFDLHCLFLEMWKVFLRDFIPTFRLSFPRIFLLSLG